MTTIAIEGQRAAVRFDRFDLDAYGLFLKCKMLPESQIAYDWQHDAYTVTTPARFAEKLGLPIYREAVNPLPLAPHLFDYQRWIVGDLALPAKRFAIWADTGLGKTAMFLEWARQVVHRTNGRVLILSPGNIIEQTRQEAVRFYDDALPIERLDTREALTAWLQNSAPTVGITNYEKLIPGQLPELRNLAGLVADESSILKSGGGVIKWNLIHSAKGIEYKLSCTATPAPNDTMEYASQGSFLEKLRTEGDILWTYFTKDQKTGDWRVKPHAREAFYRFMASWSIYIRNPRTFGFADILASLPAPAIHEYAVPITPAQRELMYGFLTQSGKGLIPDGRLGVQERSRLSQLAKGFLYDKLGDGTRAAARVPSLKPGHVADLVREEVQTHRRQVLVWTVFDEESAIIETELANTPFSIGVVHGSMPDAERMAVIERFKRGKLKVLISKAQLIGYGLNFQNCRAMVFSGFDDSFERMYQAIRRAYRFGQTRKVHVHVPYISELEGMMFNNVKAKEAAFLADVDQIERFYREALRITA